MKECPFCGEEIYIYHGSGHKHECFMGNTILLEAQPPTKQFAKQWNTRTSIPISKIEELIEKMEKLKPPYNKNTLSGRIQAHWFKVFKFDLQKLIDNNG